MKEQELKYWLAWNKVKEIGPVRFSHLIEAFPSLEKAWFHKEDTSKLFKVLQVNQKTWEKIKLQKEKIDPESELELLEKFKVKTVTIKDEEYPAVLKNTYNPPPIIYYQGDFIPITNQNKGIAIVGSRKATYYGRKVAREIAAELAGQGYIIVSGLARGIDTYAHTGSLEAGGMTIAVLGCGIDRIYPAENQSLARRIREKGALVSEFPIYTKPERGNFPRRNRIISGLTLGTLVVEAAEKSGALITADFALEQGKEVFAVPGSIHSYLSVGCHNLIKQGAKLVNNYQDILEEIGETNHESHKSKEIAKEDYKKLTEKEKIIFDILSIEPIHIDEIMNMVEIPLSQVIEVLLLLELKNIIRETEGKRYVRMV